MIALAPLAPAMGKLALAAGKGSLTRATLRSLANGAAWSAGYQLVDWIAEWARSIDGEFDTTDEGPTDAVDGCRKVDGYGQLYFNDGSGWKPAGQNGSQTLTAQTVEITGTDVRTSPGGESGYAVCTITTLDYGSVEILEGNGGLADANAIKWRIGLDSSACTDEGPGPPDDWQPMPLPPIETNGCTINTTFMGFLGNEDGGGVISPVYRVTSSVESRANGGVITGECNFQPTVIIGDGGDGKDPPRIVPDPPGPVGGPNWWSDVVKGLITGTAAAVAGQIISALLNQQEEGSFTLVAPCDTDEEGKRLTYKVDFPQQSAQDRILEWQVAQAYLLQQHLNWKTPICGNEKPCLEGEWVTTRWESVEVMPHSGHRLRKQFRYRSKSGLSLAQRSAYWEWFQWESGDFCVIHKGAWWGTPQVWAASEEEGKRVIRFAAGEAGLDPDQTGEWTVSRSSSPRYGMSGTMKIQLYKGFPWISTRGGASYPNTLAKVHDP